MQPDQGWQLQPGDQIKRSGLHTGYGASPSGRISGSDSTPNIFLFIDATNDHGSGPAEALGNDVVLFRGESGRDPHLHYANRAILDHARDGLHIRMFRGQDGLVEYVGEVIPDPENPCHIESAPTPAGSRQQKFLVFHLRATENGSSALSPNQQGGAHPATVAEATMAAFGTAYYGTPVRFDERGWELDGETDILCDACGQFLWALGKPWTSAVGVRYRFWAIACTTCHGVWDLDTYDDRTQELFRDWRRSIGKEPARVAVAPSQPRPIVPQHPPPPRPRYLRLADPPRQNLGSAKPGGSNARLVGKSTQSLSPANEAALGNWRRDGQHGVVSASGPDRLVIGLAAIKAVDSDKLNIVILVNRDARAIEWRKRLTEDLGIPADQVGALRNGVASLKVQRGVVAVASTAGGHLIQVITAWQEQGRRVLVIADGIRLSSYFFAGVTREIHAVLILREDARGSDDVSVPVMISNVIEPDRVAEIPAQEDIAVLGRVVGLFVDFTPLEKTMFASLDGNRKTPCEDPEPFTPNSYEWLKWRMRAPPVLGTKILDPAVVDKHHLAEAASGRRRALNDVLDSIDLRKRVVVIHGSRDSAEQTVRALQGRWIDVGFDHPNLTPSVRAGIRADFESRKKSVLVVEIAENQDLLLSRADIVVLAGGWGPAGGAVRLSTALCQLAIRGSLILAVFVRGSADEAIAAGFAAEIGGRYSEYRWSEEGDAIAAFRSELPANATPEPPDISLEPGEVGAKSPVLGVQVPRTCHRCSADNEATRRRCIRCHGLLDETERTTRT